MYDVIPDIHGQAEKLKPALRNLGYSERKGAWRHSDPKRHVVFLGDFIDRGPDNRECLTSAPMGQFRHIAERRVSGSS